MIVAAILGNILSGNRGSSTPNTRGAPVSMARNTRESRDRRRRGAAAMEAMDRRTRKDSNDSTRSPVVPRGPTVAEQVAARKAAKLAARKSKGQAGRKKYEQAMTQAKKMKLLFT